VPAGHRSSAARRCGWRFRAGPAPSPGAVRRGVVLLQQASPLPSARRPGAGRPARRLHDDLLHPQRQSERAETATTTCGSCSAGRPWASCSSTSPAPGWAPDRRNRRSRHRCAPVPPRPERPAVPACRGTPDSRHNESMEHPGRGREQQPEGQQPPAPTAPPLQPCGAGGRGAVSDRSWQGEEWPNYDPRLPAGACRGMVLADASRPIPW
jgi:hypothetical protein